MPPPLNASPRLDGRTRLNWATALVLILVVGAVLRFTLVAHQSFWYDESVSARLAKFSLSEMVSGKARDLGNPPLHLIVLHLWQQVFGSGDVAVRALSGVASLASIPLVAVIARRLLGERIALVAAALFALSPVQVYFAQEARVYTIVTLTCLVSIAFLLRAAESPRRWGSWAGYGIATFLAMYAHYFAAFVVVAQLVWLVWIYRFERRVMTSAAVTLAVAGFAYSLVWLPSLVAQATAKGNLSRASETWYLHILGSPLVFGMGTTLVWKGTVTPLRLVAGGLGLVGLCCTAGIGAWSLRRNRESLVLLVAWMLAPVVVPLLVSLTLFPFYNVRYGLVAAPAYYMLIAAGLISLGRRLRACAAVCLALPSALSLYFYFTTQVKHDWRGAAAWMAAHCRQGDVLAFDADIGETPFARYAGPDGSRIRLLAPPNRSPAVRYWGTSPRKEPEHSVSADLEAASRVWLVLSDPGSGCGNYYNDLFPRDYHEVARQDLRGIRIRGFKRGAR